MKQFPNTFFSKNRERVCELQEGFLYVLPAHFVLQKSADIPYTFQQDNYFWYFTGLETPDAILIIDADTGVSRLLLPEQNDYQSGWDGKQDEKELSEASGIAEISFCDVEKELTEVVKAAVDEGKKIGYLQPPEERVEPYGFYSNPSRRKALDTILSASGLTEDADQLVDCRLDLARLRQVKQQVEIDAIQHAIDVTGDVLMSIKADLSEHKSEADITRALSAGFYGKADGHGFEPIVASGKNAATIHYTDNNQPLATDSLLLLDVGALNGKYGADISRTWIVGTATKRQQELHDAILKVSKYAMSLLKPGVGIRDYQKKVEQYQAGLMKELGIEQGKYPHLISHFLGLDTHDAGDYYGELSEGMVLTVEPGVYLPDENIGIRIEDIVVITKGGNKVLSSDIPTDM